MSKPYAAACDENKRPILDVISPLFRTTRAVLEIGSGTGQHAVFFAAAMPHLTWQTSEIAERLPGIRAWLLEHPLPNLPQPLPLDVDGDWPDQTYDGGFSANTTHIMHLSQVAQMFAGVGGLLAAGARFALYGPFSRGGRHSSESNFRFDAWLRAQNPGMGVRDLDDLERMAGAAGLTLIDRIQMPVNNLTLVWEKQ